MSYEPLHHKYRPQKFSELVGQDAIATTLSNAISTGKIAPAYLFTGPRGTGKTSSARILAKSLNCLASNKPTAKPCGECEVCKGITNGSALDVIEIDAASNTGVDNIRDLIERAQFAPVQCRYKVYAIDECHMLSVAAFNALLKTLEEPPEQVVFILATTDPARVLPTIISRCQRFDFRRIDTSAMVAHLRKIAQIEQIDITNEALTLVAQVSQGGLRDAESMLDQLSLLSTQINSDRVWDLIGSVAEPDLLQLLHAIAQNNPVAVIDCVQQLLERGREAITILQNLASFYRDLLVAKTAPSRNDLASVTPATWQSLCELAQQWDTTKILLGQQRLKDSEVQIKTSTQPRLWLEVTLLELLAGENVSVVAAKSPAILETNCSTTSPTDGAIAPEPVAQLQQQLPSPPPATPPVEPQIPDAVESAVNTIAPAEDIQQIWEQVLQCLPLPSKALYKEHGSLLSIERQQARIRIRSQKLLKIAQTKLPDLEAALAKVLSTKTKAILEVNGAPQPQSIPPPQALPSPPAPPTRQTEPTASATVTKSPAVAAPDVMSTPAATQPHATVKLDLAEASATNEATDSTNLGDLATEVDVAAKRLADFFQGEVVTLDKEPSITPAVDTSALYSTESFIDESDNDF